MGPAVQSCILARACRYRGNSWTDCLVLKALLDDSCELARMAVITYEELVRIAFKYRTQAWNVYWRGVGPRFTVKTESGEAGDYHLCHHQGLATDQHVWRRFETIAILKNSFSETIYATWIMLIV
jgi:hypothetical protein